MGMGWAAVVPTVADDGQNDEVASSKTEAKQQRRVTLQVVTYRT